jgi:Flp pilus assembly protein TadG
MSSSTVESSKVMTKLSKFALRFGKDRKGVAAVEFGLLIPIIFFLYVGVWQVCRALEIDRRIGKSTTMVGDLIAREKTINDTQLQNLVSIIPQIMAPHIQAGEQSMTVTITAVKAGIAQPGVYKVEWSKAYRSGSTLWNTITAPKNKCDTYSDLPQGILGPGNSVIVVETEYEFDRNKDEMIFNKNFITNGTWTDRSLHSPRQSCVNYNGANCILTCSGWG